MLCLFVVLGWWRVFEGSGYRRRRFYWQPYLDKLLAEGFEVIALDNLRGGSFENISGHGGERNFRFVHEDIRHTSLVRKLVRSVDYVVHLAALVSVAESLRDPVLTWDINVNGTLNLLRACVDFGVKRFVYASSSAVYGSVEKLPIREDYPANPQSPYGASKLEAEKLIQEFHVNFGLETVCLRYFNVYGPRQAYSDYSGVITQFLKRIEKNLPLVIFGDGEQTRDFVYVEDVVEANLLALKSGKAVGKTFNIGTGVATSINRLAGTLLKIVDKKYLGILH